MNRIWYVLVLCSFPKNKTQLSSSAAVMFSSWGNDVSWIRSLPWKTTLSPKEWMMLLVNWCCVFICIHLIIVIFIVTKYNHKNWSVSVQPCHSTLSAAWSWAQCLITLVLWVILSAFICACRLIVTTSVATKWHLTKPTVESGHVKCLPCVSESLGTLSIDHGGESLEAKVLLPPSLQVSRWDQWL